MDTHVQQRPSSWNFLRSVLAALPTVLVLVGIAAVGWWGHETGWKAPKLSQLLGGPDTAATEDWCEAHNVPESTCIACYPELAGESAVDWCKEHGVPESKCTLCHPEILTTGVAGDWCREHGLPESGCTLCHPEIARKGEIPVADDSVSVSSVADALAVGLTDPVDGTAPTPSKPVRDPSTCQTHSLKVQFASVASMEKSGVGLGQVVERRMADSLLVYAEVDYDRTRFAKLASRVSGTARQVEGDLGQVVRAGEVLALIESAEVGRAKAELLQSQAALDVTARALTRLRASSAAGFRTEAERLEAEGQAREAEIRLFNARQAITNLGLSLPVTTVDEAMILTLGLPESARAEGAFSANVIPLTAPFDGLVVGRDVVAGEIVEPSRTLFEIADTSRMWVTMDVAEPDAHRLALGGEVVFRQDHAPDEPVIGRIAWISTAVDAMTRTVKVRAEVENAAGALRAHAFGRARIVVRTSPQAIAVPSEAVQWEGCCHIVFVRLADAIFQTRKVRLGAKDAAYTEVLAGVLPGEILVTAGSHVLKSEIQKSKLGAGCCPE